MLSEAIDAVGRMLSGYPNAKADDKKSYIGAMASLLCSYPRSIAMKAADPIYGVARDCPKFLPTVGEVVAWCEPHVESMTRINEFAQRSVRQLKERAEIERQAEEETPEHRAEVVARIRRQMATAGLPFEADRGRLNWETPAAVKKNTISRTSSGRPCRISRRSQIIGGAYERQKYSDGKPA